MKKGRFISDLKALEANERFQSVFLVQTKEVRHKRSGDPFLSLRLADRSGSIDCKMWDNVPAVAGAFEAGDFVEVRGKVQMYSGFHQVIAHKLTVVAEEQLYLGDFVPHTEADIETMYAEVVATIDGFADAHLRQLLSNIFGDPDFARRYKRAPAAAGMHHATIGGLLEHVVSVMKLAKLVASHYRELNADLLISGVLLHDAGKIFELTAERTFEYTDEGRLLGHIAIGSAWLERRCDEIDGFPPRLKTLLLHLVLSHHGKREFGSPQVPQFPEALALHFLDDLDSKLEMMRATRRDMAPGTYWSPFHRGLERFILDSGAYLEGEKPSTERGAKPRAETPATGHSGSPEGQSGQRRRKRRKVGASAKAGARPEAKRVRRDQQGPHAAQPKEGRSGRRKAAAGKVRSSETKAPAAPKVIPLPVQVPPPPLPTQQTLNLGAEPPESTD